MRLPEWLVWWALPPAQRYLRRRSPMPADPRWARGELPRRSALYAVGDAPPTDEELAVLEAEAARLDAEAGVDAEHDLERAREREEARYEQAHREAMPLARTLAQQVVATGSAHHHADGVDLDARLVRFRWGSSVLEIEATRPEGESSSRGIVPRRDAPELVEVVAHHVAAQLAAG
ncbi:hypothetical protein MM440_09525 [Arsenicicoccus piscis]|uniref:hypothetical protein n=1 Tax=Arsenicicoccus piscis TaxID=673954 RepID=UPI001F4C7576|nr:hypothetical protein [Arsenicicoccus piscis]MCH8628015.1 hypothetical protein [Arsenicicoccus piscis]